MKKITFALMAMAAASAFALAPVQADEEALARELKEISEKQDRILAELENVKAELNIVKIRVSSR